MTNETRKELIKLKTEFLKFHLIAVIGLITGITSLAARDDNAAIHWALAILGSIALPVVVMLIFRLRKQIHRLAEELS